MLASAIVGDRPHNGGSRCSKGHPQEILMPKTPGCRRRLAPVKHAAKRQPQLWFAACGAPSSVDWTSDALNGVGGRQEAQGCRGSRESRYGCKGATPAHPSFVAPSFCAMQAFSHPCMTGICRLIAFLGFFALPWLLEAGSLRGRTATATAATSLLAFRWSWDSPKSSLPFFPHTFEAPPRISIHHMLIEEHF